MTKDEAYRAAEELYLSFNQGKEIMPCDFASGRFTRLESHFLTLAGSLMVQMKRDKPEVGPVRIIWDQFLEHRNHPSLVTWLKKYGRALVQLFSKL